MPDDRRRVPFRNMIYIGDGLTDVPFIKLTKVNGGHSIAVYQDNRNEVNKMIQHGRVDYLVEADYTRGSEMEFVVFDIIDHVSTSSKTIKRHMEHIDKAKTNLDEN
ncbi:MAG: hypothetical protein AB9835_01750 [Eubacteriales bacterium]